MWKLFVPIAVTWQWDTSVTRCKSINRSIAHHQKSGPPSSLGTRNVSQNREFIVLSSKTAKSTSSSTKLIFEFKFDAHTLNPEITFKQMHFERHWIDLITFEISRREKPSTSYLVTLSLKVLFRYGTSLKILKADTFFSIFFRSLLFFNERIRRWEAGRSFPDKFRSRSDFTEFSFNERITDSICFIKSITLSLKSLQWKSNASLKIILAEIRSGMSAFWDPQSSAVVPFDIQCYLW